MDDDLSPSIPVGAFAFFEDTMQITCPSSVSIKNWLTQLPTIKLVPLALVFTYLATVPAIAVAILHPGTQLAGPDWGKHDLVKMIVLGCILAPLIETALMQWGCMRLLGKLRVKTRVAIVVSAALFGLSHSYNMSYVMTTFLVGVVLASVFAIEDARGGRPFLATLAVHALRNGMSAAFVLFVV
jgi:uncharacterized protein